MRKYLTGQSYGDSLGSLSQKQRELDRQRDRLLVTAVIRCLPFRSLGIEQCLQSELGETSLNVTGCSGTVTCKDISPVTLTLYKQVLLTHLNQGVTN